LELPAWRRTGALSASRSAGTEWVKCRLIETSRQDYPALHRITKVESIWLCRSRPTA
jgi:hypothetical protein